jgi:hypothetical protein
MSDLGKQLRDFFAAHSLPPEKVGAILAQGRAAAAGGTDAKITPLPPAARRSRWPLALAAALAILAGLGAFWLFPRGIDFAKLRPVVVAFFAHKPMYPMMSPEPEKLRQWAIEHGAPAGFRIPDKLRVLPGKGCTILDVEGKPAFLLCFMTVDAAGQPDGGLVHLVIARRGDFHGVPRSTTPALTAAEDWTFAAWAEGDTVYTIAAPVTAEVLRSFVRAKLARARVPAEAA